MSKRIEIGEYVRDKEGNITKIIRSLNLNKDVYLYLGEDGYQYSDNAIKKHSKNIIELIEERDIVEVLVNIKTQETMIYTIDCEADLHLLTKWNVKSIITKEQFKSVEYEVK